MVLAKKFVHQNTGNEYLSRPDSFCDAELEVTCYTTSEFWKR